MTKGILPNAAKKIRVMVKNHSPEILTGIGIAGMITTTIMAVQATPKALVLLEDRCEELEVDSLNAVETVKAAWICYLPASITCGFSILCLVGASSVNARRNAALATAYAISESALKDYQAKVVETIGEKKEQSVREAVSKEKLQKAPVNNSEIIMTDKGATLCFDAISGRYFRSDIDLLKRTANELSRRLVLEDYVSLNDFYYEIGLDNIPLGDDLGWHVNNGLIDLSLSSHLASDGTPCLVLDYSIAPEYQYRK